MKSGFKYTLLGFLVVAALLLTGDPSSKKTRSLERQPGNPKTSCLEARIDPNSRKSVLIMRNRNGGRMGPFTIGSEEPNHIDPNELNDYKVSYDSASKLVGNIMGGEFGYFIEGRFIMPEKDAASHIEDLGDFFRVASGGGQWLLEIKKPKGMEKVNFISGYPQGFEVKQKRMDTDSFSNIYVFPTKDYGSWYEALSPQIGLVLNPNLDGCYRMPRADANDIKNNPLESLCFIRGVEDGTWFTIPLKHAVLHD